MVESLQVAWVLVRLPAGARWCMGLRGLSVGALCCVRSAEISSGKFMVIPSSSSRRGISISISADDSFCFGSFLEGWYYRCLGLDP
ncbi:conserved peptide upstream open reading frame 28 [Striga hermonthica]|uniref:Conserved peptide upstream open reading frame 28 n=1 Tax=Striga hermonthica TaxID=68872 RepID=A0A9N7MZK8_STRHE|nr:conserved peptide upstream open reading frame 28 [Striga hermonthica]